MRLMQLALLALADSLPRRVRGYFGSGGGTAPCDLAHDDPLEYPLLHLNKTDFISVRMACSGTFITGQVGAGKTSSSGAAYARALIYNFGGCCLTAKRDECALWEGYARDTGRSDALIIVSPNNP